MNRFWFAAVSCCFGLFSNAQAQVTQCVCLPEGDCASSGMELISKDSFDVQSERHHSREASISLDGNWAVFTSVSGFLAGATSDPDATAKVYEQVYLKNLATGELLLVTEGIDGDVGNGPSHAPVVSADGRYVAFLSNAKNLTSDEVKARSDTVPGYYLHVFVYDSWYQTLELVSKTASGELADRSANPDLAFSPDGQKLAFSMDRNNLFPSDAINDRLSVGLFVMTMGDPELDFIEPVSFTNYPAGYGFAYGEARGISQPTFSSDGTKLAYKYGFGRYLASQILVHDLATRVATIVSMTEDGEPSVRSIDSLRFADDDQLISFRSKFEDFAPDEYDYDGEDAFVKNLVTGEVEHISLTNSGEKINGPVRETTISPDGTLVAFLTGATNIEDPKASSSYQVYIHNRSTGENLLVARTVDGSKVSGLSDMGLNAFSADNKMILDSRENMFVDDDANSALWDIFVRNLSGDCDTE